VSVKRALKWLVVLTVVGAITLVVWRLMTQRQPWRTPFEPWQPPAPIVPAEHPAPPPEPETAAEVPEPSPEPAPTAEEAVPPAPLAEPVATEELAAAPAPAEEPTAAPTADEQAAFEAAFEAAIESRAPEAVRPEPPADAVPEEAPSPDFLARHVESLVTTPAAKEPEITPVPVQAARAVPPEDEAGDERLVESLEEALADVAPARIIPPPKRNAERYLDEGNVFFNVGQYALAIESYGHAIELDPTLIAGYYNRANARTRAGDFEGALEDYDRALELQPGDADALNNRGMLHLYRGSFAHALADFDAAIAIEPGDTTVLVNRGLAYLHGGDADRALADFRQASAMDPSDASAQYGAAQAAAAIGNRADALRYVGRALLIDPGYAREAAADPRLALLQGDPEFVRLLREAGSRQ